MKRIIIISIILIILIFFVFRFFVLNDELNDEVIETSNLKDYNIKFSFKKKIKNKEPLYIGKNYYEKK